MSVGGAIARGVRDADSVLSPAFASFRETHAKRCQKPEIGKSD